MGVNHRIQYNQKVWRHTTKPYEGANGYVANILWSDETVIVKFWTKDDCYVLEEYDFDTMQSAWESDTFGGTYMLY